jgi:hypothetical protein
LLQEIVTIPLSWWKHMPPLVLLRQKASTWYLAYTKWWSSSPQSVNWRIMIRRLDMRSICIRSNTGRILEKVILIRSLCRGIRLNCYLGVQPIWTMWNT